MNSGIKKNPQGFLVPVTKFTEGWFSLATQAYVQAQTQAIGTTQVKRKFNANTSTSRIIQTFQTA